MSAKLFVEVLSHSHALPLIDVLTAVDLGLKDDSTETQIYCDQKNQMIPQNDVKAWDLRLIDDLFKKTSSPFYIDRRAMLR